MEKSVNHIEAKSVFKTTAKTLGACAAAVVVLVSVRSCMDAPSETDQFNACVEAGHAGKTVATIKDFTVNCGNTFLPSAQE